MSSKPGKKRQGKGFAAERSACSKARKEKRTGLFQEM